MQHRNGRLLSYTLTLGAALALAACGGGGGETPEPPPPPDPLTVTLSGQVARNGVLKNVIVCLDLNGNDACDTGEPASEPTGADGNYSLTYLTSAVPDAASAGLIAPVKAGDPATPTTAIDSYNPAVAATTTDYVLKRPAGSDGAINPLTTLVQAGVAAGMTEADARANVALQLAIDAAKIENYQDDPTWDDAQVRDNARTAAAMISGMLRTGVPLEVGDQNAAVDADAMLYNLYFDSLNDFFVVDLQTQAKAAGTPGAQVKDARIGKTGGVDRPIGGGGVALYRSAYLTDAGWTWCGPDVLVPTTIGNPSRALTCDARETLGWTRKVPVEGQSMAAYVADGSRAGTYSGAGLGAALNAATFPGGTNELLRTSVVLSYDITIDNFATRSLPNDTRGTLDAVVAYYATSGAAVPTGSNTLSLGVTTGPLRNLRVSFGDGHVATYYECDLNEEQTVVSNCAAAATGTYSIDMVNGEQVMRFAGKPATPAMTYDVVYTMATWPTGTWVYRAHEIKPDFNSRLSTTSRLNATGWDAIKAQLGL
ncbi:MAG: hypothetical protein OZ923_11725 [Comamonadaceae bacterium]|nr:hypothetical protein [Comamonadaceae bacterium]